MDDTLLYSKKVNKLIEQYKGFNIIKNYKLSAYLNQKTKQREIKKTDIEYEAYKIIPKEKLTIGWLILGTLLFIFSILTIIFYNILPMICIPLSCLGFLAINNGLPEKEKSKYFITKTSVEEIKDIINYVVDNGIELEENICGWMIFPDGD